jgi:hypothetical protein
MATEKGKEDHFDMCGNVLKESNLPEVSAYQNQ